MRLRNDITKLQEDVDRLNKENEALTKVIVNHGNFINQLITEHNNLKDLILTRTNGYDDTPHDMNYTIH